MKSIKRRTFLGATATTLATAALTGPTISGADESAKKNPWKKAFMHGGLSKGSPLANFQLLKDAGFDGVELISPNELDLNDVLSARDKTGLTIHGVSGSRHWQDALSDPDPQVVARGMAAIRREFADCKAYGGTTVLVVPAVVTRKVSYRDAYKRSQKYIRELIPDAEQHGVKIAIEMHPGFIVYSPETLLRLRAIAGPNVGCNFDPSHLFWQSIDPIAAVRVLEGAIFHVHAKDTQLYPINLPRTGVLDTKPYTDERARGWLFRTCGRDEGRSCHFSPTSGTRSVRLLEGENRRSR